MLSIWPRAQPNDSKHTWDAAINKISREQCMLASFRLLAAGFYIVFLFKPIVVVFRLASGKRFYAKFLNKRFDISAKYVYH